MSILFYPPVFEDCDCESGEEKSDWGDDGV